VTVGQCVLCGKPLTVGQKGTHITCKERHDQGIHIDYLPEQWTHRMQSADKPWLTDEYLKYIKSDQWKAFRRQVLESTGYVCQITDCGIGHGLHVHHVTYIRLGREHRDDVLVLCELHHELEHRRIDAERLDEARFHGWARKVFGDNYNTEHAYNRYEAWLERREYA
jgi:hypothetical protein